MATLKYRKNDGTYGVLPVLQGPVGPQGEQGPVGPKGDGIQSISSNESGYLTTVDTNGNITNMAISTAKQFFVTFSASGWSENLPYTQQVAVQGIRVTDYPIIDIDMSNTTVDNNEELLTNWGYIGRIVTDDNSLTAYCYEDKPTLDLSVNLITIR